MYLRKIFQVLLISLNIVKQLNEFYYESKTKQKWFE